MLFGKEYDYSIVRTTSKDALKRTALIASGNDIKKAEEIYDFFIKDLPNMPDYDVPQPSSLDQIKNTAVGFFQWARENQDQIIGVTNTILQLMGKQPMGVPMTPVEVPPPIE